MTLVKCTNISCIHNNFYIDVGFCQLDTIRIGNCQVCVHFEVEDLRRKNEKWK